MLHDSILDTIGHTPVVRVRRLFGPDARVWSKLERANPGGSIKDRIALAMIDAAERDGRLAPGATIVEPTSGNTGVGLALVGAARGYRVVLVMPESMSIERRRLMAAYGAELVLTPKEGGMKAAIEEATRRVAETEGAWMPQQFENPANPDVHVRTTAEEILADFPDGLDALVTGVGTGGHIAGIGRVLKARWPGVRVVAVEPEASPVLSGGAPSPHRIQGIGAGFVPANYDPSVVDEVVTVSNEAAMEMARRSAREEGVLIGISSGASLAAVARVLPALPEGARVLTFCYDTGERYLSIDDLF